MSLIILQDKYGRQVYVGDRIQTGKNPDIDIYDGFFGHYSRMSADRRAIIRKQIAEGEIVYRAPGMRVARPLEDKPQDTATPADFGKIFEKPILSEEQQLQASGEITLKFGTPAYEAYSEYLREKYRKKNEPALEDQPFTGDYHKRKLKQGLENLPMKSITYREWLIGMVASSVAASYAGTEFGSHVIHLTESIITALEYQQRPS